MNSSTAKSCDYGSDELEHIAAIHSSGNVLKALDCYDEYLKAHPLDYSALNLYGICNLQMGRLNEALFSLDRAISLDPFPIEAWLNRASINVAMNKPSEAINDYLQALERGGETEIINPKLMPLYFKVGRLREAKQTAKALIASGIEVAEANIVLGKIKLSDANTKAAIDYFQTALNSDPNHCGALTALAQCKITRGNYREAVHLAEKATRINSNNFDANFCLTVANQLSGDLVEALKYARISDQQRPNCSEIKCKIGQLLLMLGRFVEAKEWLEFATQLSKSNAEAHFNLGVVLMHLRRFDMAVKEFDKSIKLQPKLPKAYSQKGLCEAKLLLSEKAKRSFYTALALDPCDPTALEFQASIS